MEVLVIGASGKTGTQVTGALRSLGATVRAGGRTPGAPADGVVPVRFDWTDRGTWADALGDAEGLYIVGPTAQPDADVLVRELLAEPAGVRRVVLLSVLGADRLPEVVPMAGWEQDVRNSGKEWTILRPNWFQQNFGDGAFTSPLRDKGVLELPDGDAALSFIDTRDIAEVAAIALVRGGHGGRTYDLTGPQSLTYTEALAVLGSAADRELAYVALDPQQHSDQLRAAGLNERFVIWQQGLHTLIRDGLNTPVTDAVRQITGHDPRSLADYAAERAGALR
ncbi:NAD(P)H-binding protein [Actinospica robiniae]|uniref:NAD(P)H-binding protein n=1 Tax=Actinospica robiniae TaxID=304901 RepID=UPI000413B88B|nr:NAD(P)H-binding protein [Actinospica robiniae]